MYRPADRFIVVAAHYDHLGIWFDDVHPGANDNASGVVVLLDAADRLAASGGLGRSVLVCSFDAEEPPHFLTENMGSIHFVANPTVPLNQIDLMICLDLLGHSLGPVAMPSEVRESIFVLGVEGVPVLIVGITPHRLRSCANLVTGDHEFELIPELAFPQTAKVRRWTQWQLQRNARRYLASCRSCPRPTHRDLNGRAFRRGPGNLAAASERRSGSTRIHD